MRSFLVAALAVSAVLVVPATAPAAPNRDFNFEHGQANYRTSVATRPGAYQEGITPRQPCPASGVPGCTWEAHEFTIGPGDTNGAFSVTITWGSADDDWDLFVYRVLPNGSVDEANAVAKSAQGGTTQETATLLSSPDAPIEPGTYRIYVDNWAAADPSWKGVVQFETFVPGNTLPTAVLAPPPAGSPNQFVTLDASGSSDPDGTIENYAWDLDGDGKFDIDGASPQIAHKFRRGTTHVSVRVRDNKGAVGFASQPVTVAGPPGQDQTVLLPPPPGSITMSMKRRQSLAAVRLRGVAATLTCPTSCRIAGRLSISGATARRLGLGRRGMTISRRTRTLSGTNSTPRLRLKPGRRTLAALRRSSSSVSATVRVTVSAEGYQPMSFLRRVTIVR